MIAFVLCCLFWLAGFATRAVVGPVGSWRDVREPIVASELPRATMTRRQRRRLVRERLDVNTAHRGRWS